MVTKEFNGQSWSKNTFSFAKDSLREDQGSLNLFVCLASFLFVHFCMCGTQIVESLTTNPGKSFILSGFVV